MNWDEYSGEKDTSNSATAKLHGEYRDDKEHVPAGEPHGGDTKQRWWVDYNHNVKSGTLIDLSDTQAVVRSHSGFEIKTPSELCRSYIEACAVASSKLSKIVQETTEKQAKIMLEMSKAAKGKS